jgi:predicted signal transduction protein with EAL and GGDEF domain
VSDDEREFLTRSNVALTATVERLRDEVQYWTDQSAGYAERNATLEAKLAAAEDDHALDKLQTFQKLIEVASERIEVRGALLREARDWAWATAPEERHRVTGLRARIDAELERPL